MNTITFYSEEDHKEVIFNGETLTLTLQLIKLWTIKWVFKNLNLILIVQDVDIRLLKEAIMV